MPTVVMPSAERWFLQTFREEITREPLHAWPPQSLRLYLKVLGKLRQETADARTALEEQLASGVEARSFVQNFGQHIEAAANQLTIVRDIITDLSATDDVPARELLVEFRSLEQESAALHKLLEQAATLASAAHHPVDWARIQESEQAYARSETKEFTRR
jgi:hypothetical protein